MTSRWGRISTPAVLRNVQDSKIGGNRWDLSGCRAHDNETGNQSDGPIPDSTVLLWFTVRWGREEKAEPVAERSVWSDGGRHIGPSNHAPRYNQNENARRGSEEIVQ